MDCLVTREITIEAFAERTREHPMALHLNPIGLIRLGKTNEERFDTFHTLLHDAEQCGANIAIPTFTYSFVGEKEVFNVKETPSTLDPVSEYLRIRNPRKRTLDANFSYLVFGKNFSARHFNVGNVSSFGEGGLIEEIYTKDGYLCAIGGVLEHLTEIHFIERKLGLRYRFDTEFEGIVIDGHDNKSTRTMTYCCRDLNSDYIASFLQLKHDLREMGLVERWSIEGYDMRLEVIKFKRLYNFIREQVRFNPKYLWGIK